MKLEEQIKLIIEDKLHVKIRHNGETLSDMCADELDIIEIANEFEDMFDIKINNEELSEELTVREVVRLVAGKIEGD